MSKLVFLGTSNAIPDLQRENTHLVLVGEHSLVLVDSGHNPLVRLRQAGLDPLAVSAIFLTHFHPDHVSGVPSFLMNNWLLGRRAPLDLYGLPVTLKNLNYLMELYTWQNWPNFYPVHFHFLDETLMELALEDGEFRILSSPVEHMIPALGVRIEHLPSGRSVAYSGDTSPCRGVLALAHQVDVLIHEAGGDGYGHSSAAQAGRTAQQAGACSLRLVHYATGTDTAALVAEARSEFDGPVDVAVDFEELEF